MEVTAKERFWSKVDRRGPDECWPWLGENWKGYGKFWLDGRKWRAPRIAWSFHHDKPFPEELFACHTCDNPTCVNPAHIWPGTNSENMKDAFVKGRHNPNLFGWQKTKTECKRGHPFTPENTHIYGRGHRKCRVCERMLKANHRARKRALTLLATSSDPDADRQGGGR